MEDTTSKNFWNKKYGVLLLFLVLQIIFYTYFSQFFQ